MTTMATNARIATRAGSNVGGASLGSHDSFICKGTKTRRARIPMPKRSRASSRSVHSYHPGFPCRSRIARLRALTYLAGSVETLRAAASERSGTEVTKQAKARRDKDPRHPVCDPLAFRSSAEGVGTGAVHPRAPADSRVGPGRTALRVVSQNA